MKSRGTDRQADGKTILFSHSHALFTLSTQILTLVQEAVNTSEALVLSVLTSGAVRVELQNEAAMGAVELLPP